MNVRRVDRKAIERIARIMGLNSAAAQALAEADAHDGPCRFYQTLSKRTGSHIVVERLADEEDAADG